MDFTELRDLSLGVVAIGCMAFIIMRVMQWQLEERRAWTAEVKKWGEQQKADRDLLISVVGETNKVLQQFADVTASADKARAEREGRMADCVKEITVALEAIHEDIADHRTVTEGATAAHKRKPVH